MNKNDLVASVASDAGLSKADAAKATTGLNPQTGAVIQIRASNQEKFNAGKGLKDAVN